MALVSGGSSTLNPNAPLFIPAAFRMVEDFSPEWWELVQTSAWFQDYWLNQHPDEDNFDGDANDNDIVSLLPDTFDIGIDEEFPNLDFQLEELVQSFESKEETESALTALKKETESALTALKKEMKRANGLEIDAAALLKDLSLCNSPKGRGPKSPIGPAKYCEKPAQCVSPKYVTHRIQQPR